MPVLEENESVLIERSRAGDLDAFNRLVLRYQTQVYNLCFRLLGSRPAAEDATQDAFIAAYRAASGFRSGSFRAWLFRIAANGCYDEMRRRKARPAISLETSREEEPGIDPPAQGPSLEELVHRSELTQHIQQALHELPFDQRLAVVLSDVQGFSYEEIAQVTNTNLGTVKSRLARGRGRLRQVLIEQHRELLPDQFRQME